MGRRNRNGFAWTKADDGGATAATRIGTYAVVSDDGHPGVVACFARSSLKDKVPLGRYATVERAKSRCAAHYDEMRHILRPVSVSPDLRRQRAIHS